MNKRSLRVLRRRSLMAGSLLACAAPLAAQDAPRPAAAETVSAPAPSALDLAERSALETLSNARVGGAGERGGGGVRLSVDDAPRRAPRVERPVSRTFRSPREREDAPALPDKQMLAATVREKEWRLSFDAGFQTRFIQHGLDIIGFNSAVINPLFAVRQNNGAASIIGGGVNAQGTSSINYTDAVFSRGGFSLGLGGVFANESTIPFSRGARYVVDSVNATLATVPVAAPPPPSKSRYSEIQLRFDYSRPLIGKWLEGTIGYNAYFFPERAFRNTRFQGEAFAKLTLARDGEVLGRPFSARLSLAYFNLHSFASLPQIKIASGSTLGTFGNGQILFPSTFALQYIPNGGGTYLSGSYFELKAESTFVIFNTANLTVGIVPSALVSYNFGYATQGNINSDDLVNSLARGMPFPNTPRRNEFNTFEAGLKVPIVIRKRFTVTPYFTYGVDISDSGGLANAFGSKSKPNQQDVWGGVQVAYSF